VLIPILVTESAAYTVWGISLALGLVVILVVAALLWMITRTAQQINEGVGQIWVTGQRIANNTIHIPLLKDTNRGVTGILQHAIGIDGAAAAIEQHAEGCPGCPSCVRGDRR
jgi:hypothetical protein